MEHIKRIGRELIHRGQIIDYYQDIIQVSNGNVVRWDFIEHKGAAAIVPVDTDGQIVMVRQYRNALERYTLEIPAGGCEAKDSDPKACALRELEEEAGYKAEDAEHLIDIYTTVAFCNEKIYIYVARDLVPSKQHLDEDEFVDIVKYPIEALLDKIYRGEIQDSKTISALMAYYHKYCK